MKRIRRDERGSSLVIALVFLTVFSLWLSATMTASETGLHVNRSMRVQPAQMYGADGVVERVIQQMRYDASMGVDEGPSFVGPPSCGLVVQDAPMNGHDWWVDCEPADGSGVHQVGGSSPTLGIIALSTGQGGEAGYRQKGNTVVRLDGGVYTHTEALFEPASQCTTSSTAQPCQELNLCPNNKKTATDGTLVIGSRAVLLGLGSLTATPPIAFENTPQRTDVGAPITDSRASIPAGTTIESVVSSGSATMSRAATRAGVGDRRITFREDYPLLQKHCLADPATAHGTFTVGDIAHPEQPRRCWRERVVALSFNCENTFVANLRGIDPAYPPEPATFSSDATVPPCGTGRVVELNPGRYTNATALTQLTTTCDKLIHFRPGPYYFQFPASNPLWIVGAAGLQNQVIVAGDRAWDPSKGVGGVFAANVVNGSQGAQFRAASSGVFRTGAYLNSGYCLKRGTRITAVTGNVATISPPGPASGCPIDATIGGSPFTISSTSEAGQQSAGSMCDARTDDDHPGVQFIFGGQSRVEFVDGKTELCARVNGASQQIAIYGARPGGGYAPQTGCVTATPYPPPPGGACALVKTTGPKTQFMLHGTIYAPNAAIDLSLQTVTYQVVSRGIIARVIVLEVSPSVGFLEPLIYSPNFGSVVGTDREVLLTACMDAPCSSASVKKKLRAVVRIQDVEPDTTNVSIGHKVSIDSWSVLR